MPEGDTIHRLAAVLAPHLVGEPLEHVELWGRPEPSLRRRVESVRALGKHLLIGLEGGETIRNHLGMHGNWRRFASQGELASLSRGVGAEATGRRRGFEAPRRRSLVLVNRHGAFVCFDAELADCVPSGRRLATPGLARIGPDLLAEIAPADDIVVARARRFVASERPVCDLLLDQRVASGIGNVYKSELLFLHRIEPATPAGILDDAEVVALYRDARRLLLQNLGPWPRTTTWVPREGRSSKPGLPRLHVYGRVGEACLDCAAPIVERRMGRGNRRTFWCPGCQPSRTEAGLRSTGS